MTNDEFFFNVDILSRVYFYIPNIVHVSMPFSMHFFDKQLLLVETGKGKER